jgi:quercetin dioxygenase-like cupin family protein
MDAFTEDRRAFLRTLAALGISPSMPWPGGAVHSAPSPGYVLGSGGGEHLVHFRDGGDVCIKLSPVTGSTDLALGTQQVKVGTGIPEHRHPAMEEAFFVLQGRGTVRLDDVGHSFEAGSSIFIPRMTWHAFENPEQELLLLWIVSPSGLEAFFRQTCSPPGVPPKGLTREQIREVARRHGTEFR